MPGMMDTVLNLGLNDRTVEGLAADTGDERFAWDSYRRFIQMYGDVVMGVDHDVFEEILQDEKAAGGHELDTGMSAAEWRAVVAALQGRARGGLRRRAFRRTRRSSSGARSAAVFSSWRNARAVTYRQLHSIPSSPGTAVNLQAMVFGNLGENSATGVAFTRNPSTGERQLYGEFLVNAQGEDVVAGIRTPQALTERARIESGSDKPSLEKLMPEVFADLSRDLLRPRDPLQGHAGSRIHDRARQAVAAADAARQAHRPGRPEDRRRHDGGGADRSSTRR